MSFRAIPMFPGDMYDTALRLAAGPGPAWRQMLELGWQGVLVAEADGGAGATLQDLAAIVEATARHGLAVPLADRCGVAPVALAAARAHPAAAALLELTAGGSVSVCPVLDAGANGPVATVLPLLDGAGRLSGQLAGAELGEPATHVLFSARDADGAPVLVLLPFDRLADAARRHVGIDGRESADIALDGQVAGPGAVLLRGPAAADAATRACHAGAVLGCTQAVGAAAAMIELTIDYLNTRSQFGAPLSSFQALRHRVVEMYVIYENLGGLVRRLVDEAQESGLQGFPRQVAAAKLYAATACRTVAESVIQLHGGMGMTWEMLAARLAMQSLGGSLRYGGRAECLDWLTARALADAAAA